MSNSFSIRFRWYEWLVSLPPLPRLELQRSRRGSAVDHYHLQFRFRGVGTFLVGVIAFDLILLLFLFLYLFLWIPVVVKAGECLEESELEHQPTSHILQCLAHRHF